MSLTPTAESYATGAPAQRQGFGSAGGRPRQRTATALRLFVTCWLVYVVHFSSNIVREIYPALAIGDHLSFRVDEYAHLHPDLFEKKGYGWHIGANPGASMVAALPYAMARPLIDQIVARVLRQRAEAGLAAPPAYHSPWPMAREFHEQSWRRGLDIKFGLAALVMQSLCMAPSSALGVVGVFWVLRRLFASEKSALWLSLVYAFGTPVFYRSGYLNHNLMLGHIAFLGFLAIWNPWEGARLSSRTRFALAGLAGGTAVLFDYSGVILLLGLFAYGALKRLRTGSPGDAALHLGWYAFAAAAPIALLWVYQYQSFGHPFYPGQHWMPPVEWIDRGYQGFELPQLDLLWALAFDPRFGLFVTCPLLLLAVVALVRRHPSSPLPGLESWAILALSVSLIVFFSCVNYTRLQFNTGLRYLAPVIPFLFIPAATVLMRLPRKVVYFLSVFSVFQGWSLAMHRDVESGFGVLNPLMQVLLGGFKLPLLTVLSRMDAFGRFFENGPSPLPLMLLLAAIIYGIWAPRAWLPMTGRGDG